MLGLSIWKNRWARENEILHRPLECPFCNTMLQENAFVRWRHGYPYCRTCFAAHSQKCAYCRWERLGL